MEKIQFISNNTDNHLDIILQNFIEADEVWMATAFLKMSGLNLLFPTIKKHLADNKRFNLIAGKNFGLTDPEALRKLYDEFGSNSKANFYLDKADNNESVFHPKLFLFKKGRTGVILTGSANITSGGLINNKEVSLLVETGISASSWNEAVSCFQEMCSIDNAEPLSLMVINRYKSFYNDQKQARVHQKVSPKKKSSEFTFNYENLMERLKDYKTGDYKKIFKQREKDYEQAKELLIEIADSKRLTQKRFEEIIDSLVGKSGQSALWKSGSMFRHRAKVYECKDEFRELIKFVKENQNLSVSYIFSQAKKLVENINGARINYVTEILMTFQPNRFANLNSNPITVLREEAGVYFKSHSTSFNGNDYEEYCSLITEIRQKLDLKNMLEVDSFFNEIYWHLKYE